jgi:hypothetical protein
MPSGHSQESADATGENYVQRFRQLEKTCVALAGLALSFGRNIVCVGKSATGVARTPVIDVTDLYHPYQDRRDIFDLVTAYALPEDWLALIRRTVPARSRAVFLSYASQDAATGLQD